MAKLETQGPAGEVQMTGYFDQGPQRHSFHRYRMATPKRVQVDAVAVIGCHHGQASEPAFGRFRLLDDGQAAARPGEVQQIQCHGHILTLSKGSSNQLASARFSRMISALRSMSAWSDIFAP